MKYSRWTNLRVTKVEEAGTLWVREVPSHSCSEELSCFLELEKQLNEHFRNKWPQDRQHFMLLKIGNVSFV
ncbi:hypothetical protein E2C01_082967 [Portunus trituberculatus]|uniref:Uncharacterized protein n=1 Tax=Portunus trituberculatus TaxID=210409 RepID=A0A5B7J394_PORTR|nr:hypothetical protein [Portunus trituberculatus]